MSQLIKFVALPLACSLLWACSAPETKSPVETPGRPESAKTQLLEAGAATLQAKPGRAELRHSQITEGAVRMMREQAPGFAPAHVANIRTLAREGFWNGLAIYRSQDNFVVQFGDADAEDTARAKPLGTAKTKLPAEFARTGDGVSFTRLPDVDGWAPEVGFVDGFPVGRDPKTNEVWLAHCYGALGAGRGGPPDSSNGSELYVVTGQSPRQLDRNITLVGRVVKGMELLSAIPRGPEPMGFYEKPEQRTPITAVRLASDVPENERMPLLVLRTDSKTFAAATEARRNRRDGWYVRPAGHIDLCNVPVPVRTAVAAK